VAKQANLLLLWVAMAASVGCVTSSSAPIVYVSLPSTNGIQAFRLDVNTGALTAVVGTPFLVGDSPTSMALSSSGQFLYVVNRSERDISLFKINSGSAKLSEVLPRAPTGLSPTALTINGGFAFVANQGSSTISIYSINGSNGALTETSSSPFLVGNLTNPGALAITPSGKFLYAASPSLSSLFLLSVDSHGNLQQLPSSPFNLAKVPVAMTIDPTGKFLYTANTDGTLSGLLIGSDGSLTAISGSPFTAGILPSSLAVHPSGALLYVTNAGSNNISVYRIDSTSGTLTQLNSSPFPSGAGPSFVAIDPAGKFLFVCNQSAKTISQLIIESQNGALISNFTAVPTFSQPVVMVIRD